MSSRAHITVEEREILHELLLLEYLRKEPQHTALRLAAEYAGLRPGINDLVKIEKCMKILIDMCEELIEYISIPLIYRIERSPISNGIYYKHTTRTLKRLATNGFLGKDKNVLWTSTFFNYRGLFNSSINYLLTVESVCNDVNDLKNSIVNMIEDSVDLIRFVEQILLFDMIIEAF